MSLRSMRLIPKPPNPHFLYPLRRTESIFSIDSSLVPHSTDSEKIFPSSDGHVFCSMKSGSQHEVVSHAHCSNKSLCQIPMVICFKIEIISCTQALLEISLCTKDAWPSSAEKMSAAYSALSWAGIFTQSKEWPQVGIKLGQCSHGC